ncbi:hypothetical protein LIA77_00981 [Sarocladium implicatum]|nr:hypothetical protein LIA77_00981 [Sarocladium implicatum]
MTSANLSSYEGSWTRGGLRHAAQSHLLEASKPQPLISCCSSIRQTPSLQRKSDASLLPLPVHSVRVSSYVQPAGIRWRCIVLSP